jgi:hypothetical protein
MMHLTVEKSRIQKDIDKAKSVFSDMKEFFESEEKQRYLTTIIPPKDVLLVLEELERCFLEIEDYEKCTKIEKWKIKLNRNLPPDVIFDHLY